MRIVVNACGNKIRFLYYESDGRKRILPTEEPIPSYEKEAFIMLLDKVIAEKLSDLPYIGYWEKLYAVEIFLYAEQRFSIRTEEYAHTHIVFTDMESLIPVYAKLHLTIRGRNYTCSFPNGTEFLYDAFSDAYVYAGEKEARQDGFLICADGKMHFCTVETLISAYLETGKPVFREKNNRLIEKYGMVGIHTSPSAHLAYDVYFTERFTENSSVSDFFEKNKTIVFYDRVFFESLPDEKAAYYKKFFEESIVFKAFPITTYGANGEKKDSGVMKRILDIMIENHVTRDTYAVAIGGGVLLDLVGCAASLYKRGIPWIKIPATLVGQIDAGIGIKVGFHYANRKNLLGSFYPAEFVINSFEFIEVLNRKKTECGLAEIIKIAMICDFGLLKELMRLDADFFEKIKNGKSKEQRKLFYEIITRAGISILNLLKNDPYETESKGRYFDFGHSFIGCLENNGMSHGYAVALEMLFCVILSYRNGWITEEYYRFLLEIFRKYRIVKPFCLRIFAKEYERIRDAFVGPILVKRDGNLNFVVPVGQGKAGFLNFDSCRDCGEHLTAVWSEEKFYREMDLAYGDLCAIAHIFE
ncbi:MAG: hypothetical protein IJA86_06855 [Clostridia bacterium]|nr:hypothetical protein [Clostridia bacterium]